MQVRTTDVAPPKALRRQLDIHIKRGALNCADAETSVSRRGQTKTVKVVEIVGEFAQRCSRLPETP